MKIFSIKVFDRIYIRTMILFSFAMLYGGFQFGFRPLIGMSIMLPLVLYIAPVILLITVIYFITLIVMRLKTKKWMQNKWTNILPILIVLSFFVSLNMINVGTYTAYFYAGFNNLRKDADELIATAPAERTEVNHSEYPPSFKRVGAGRVFKSSSSVTIWRGGWVSKKNGIIIYANDSHKAINSGAYNESQLSNRIFNFSLN
ncbi:MAG: hypothetical protein KAJ66_03290 [Candidatus Omnitrophica bacterium]|nr:hypothetical protein [Candidatus Omnitrophota bacterium]